MKSVRIFLAIVALLIVVIVFIITSLQLLIDPNKLKPFIVAEVKKQTNYDLKMDGNLSWSFFPLFTIKTDKISLSKAGQPVSFLEMNQINLGTSLGKLFFRSMHPNDLSGFIDVAQVNFQGIQAKNVSMRFLFKNRGLTLDPIYASLYGGTLHAELFAADLVTVPRWQGQFELNDIQIQPLLADLKLNHQLNIVGLAKFTMVGASTGKTSTQLLQNLNGTATFEVRNGLLLGIDLNYLLASAQAIINRNPLPAPPAEPLASTPFTALLGSAQIQNGIAHLQNATITSTLFNSTSSGIIDLNKQTLDLKLQIIPKKTSNNSWAIPVVIKGDLAHPSISLDMDEINKMALHIGIEKVKEKAKQEIEKHLPELPNFIQKFLH